MGGEGEPDGVAIEVIELEDDLSKNKGKKPAVPAQEAKEKDGEEEKQLAPYLQLYRYASFADKMMMFVGAVAAMAAGATMPVMTVILGRLIDIFLPENLQNPDYNVEQKIKDTSIIFIWFALANLVASYIQVTFWTLSAEKQLRRIREHYLQAVLRQEIGWYDTTKPSELSTRIANDTVLMQDAMGEKVSQLFQHNATFLAGIAVGFAYGWQLALVVLSMVPVIAGLGGFTAKVMASVTVRQQKSYAKAGGVAEQTISGIRTVSTFGGEEKESKRYEDLLQDGMRMGVKNGILNGIGFGGIMCIIFGTYALAFWFGTKLIVDDVRNHSRGHNWTGGDVITTFFAVLLGTMGVGNTSPSVAAISQGRGAGHKVLEVIDRQSKIDPSDKSGKTLDREQLQGEIEFRDIFFNYPSRPDVDIFKGFNLVCKAGQTTALVGDSGGGKSTVIGLIERFYDPNQGQVLLDGTDLREINLHSLRATVGLVSQEPVLFAGTIAENIRMGKPGASMDEIINAAKAANAHDFISQMPQGYDTVIGEKGSQISGGQKQRVAIARAVIKDPIILLLDEATSALDAESEAVVQEALDRLMVGRTTVVVAHRLTTIRGAHSIAAVRRGRVVEQGTHDELLGLQGLYYELHSRANARKEGANPEDGQHASGHVEAQGSEPTDDDAAVAEVELARSSSALLDVEAGTKAEKEVTVSWSRLLSYSKPEAWQFFFGFLGATMNGVVQPIYAIIFAEMLKVFQSTDKGKMMHDAKFWSGMFCVIAVGSAVGLFTQIYYFTIVGEKLTGRLRALVYNKILRMQMGFFDREENRTGTLTANLATDATQVRSLTTLTLGLICNNTVQLVTGLVIALAAGWKLALVVMSTMPALIGAAWVQMSFLKGAASAGKDAYGPAGQIATEAISAIRTVASFNSEEYILNRYSLKLESPYRVGIQRAHIAGFAVGFANGANYFVNCLAFWYGGQLIGENEWPASDSEIRDNCGETPDAMCVRMFNVLAGFQVMMRVFIAIILVAMNVGRAFSFMPDVTKAQDGARNIFKILDAPSEIDPLNEGGERIANVRGEIEFKEVHFSYPIRKNKKIFRGLNLRIPPGQTLALVGDSGGGKSTVIQMLERFYDPDAGAITLDGIDIRNLNIRFLRRTMGLVSQEPTLFDTTILKNLKYGREDATMDEVEAAARAANAHEFISALPEGYNTPLGDKFTQLSGGQKQRVAIARAILCDPRVLLLDEATSALDSQSEKLVQGALDNLMKGRTAVVIAHRLSTVRNANCIAVIRKGAVVELGTHEELLARGGHYYKLVQRQL